MVFEQTPNTLFVYLRLFEQTITRSSKCFNKRTIGGVCLFVGIDVGIGMLNEVLFCGGILPAAAISPISSLRAAARPTDRAEPSVGP